VTFDFLYDTFSTFERRINDETMISLNGVYEDGVITLERKLEEKRAAKVIVTFLDDDVLESETKLTLNDFSFQNAREKSKRYKGNLSDAVLDERRDEV
jgi:hypothetical protein